MARLCDLRSLSRRYTFRLSALPLSEVAERFLDECAVGFWDCDGVTCVCFPVAHFDHESASRVMVPATGNDPFPRYVESPQIDSGLGDDDGSAPVDEKVERDEGEHARRQGIGNQSPESAVLPRCRGECQKLVQVSCQERKVQQDERKKSEHGDPCVPSLSWHGHDRPTRFTEFGCGHRIARPGVID
jgi:hypothetical protein